MATELEFTGRDVREAVEKACFSLQINEAELEYEVVCQPSRKLFGLLGGRDARIRVINREPSGRQLVQDLIKSTFGEGYEAAAAEDGGKVPQSSGASRQGQEKNSARPERHTAKPEPAAGGERRGAAPNKRRARPNQAKTHQTKMTVDSNVEFEPQVVVTTLGRILELMGFAGVEITAEPRPGELLLELNGSGLGPLTARRGAVLDALQFLINKIHGLKGGRILVDCDNFRSRHEEDISELALRLGAKAKRLRKPVTINALNAHDRRLVHLALQDDQELHSRSKGDGEFKKIVIYPANSQSRRRSRSKSSSSAEAV
jgi:spoIIIJ-associated protein